MTNEDTVDYWRHKRMHDTLLPILNNYKDAKWLTVGDGKYGTDAHYILKYTPNVLPTDIAEDCLKMAKETGFIPDYKIENAEQMSFKDNEFDFALVKEAYHHFPRPSIAVYEMLRVAKKGIVLIEPNDPNVQSPQKFYFKKALFWFLQGVKNSLKKAINKEPFYELGGYETVGNFVYTISEREIEKIALALNYDMVAFKGLNDDYIEGVENELIKDNGPLFQKIKKTIELEDRKVKNGKRVYSILTAIIFKEMPSDECINDMKKEGFDIRKLMKNPYI
jgi:ubiquinone/menaquinone biosynthesis C-methylase UbiE